MLNILFVDLDGTIRQPITGKWIQPWDNQEPMPGAKRTLEEFYKKGWLIIGITNQGGVAAGHKTLEECMKEQQYTLNIFPEIQMIQACPDFEGEQLISTERGVHSIVARSDFPHPNYPNDLLYPNFRKPESGMVMRAIDSCGLIDANEVWMVGDRLEDEGCARNAGINFCHAEIWRNIFGGAYNVNNVNEAIITPEVQKLCNLLNL